MLTYVNFVYNTTNRRTEESLRLVSSMDKSANILLICSTRSPTIKKGPRTSLLTGSMGNLGRPIRMHGRFWESIKTDSKINLIRKFLGKPYEVKDNVWVFSKHKAKSKNFFLPWKGPYGVLERTSEVNYNVSKPQSRDKRRILHYNLLKPFVEEELETSEHRATTFRSTNCY